MEEKIKLSGSWIERRLSFKERQRFILELLETSRNPSASVMKKKFMELFPEKTPFAETTFRAWKRANWREILEIMDTSSARLKSKEFQKSETDKKQQ